MDIAGRPFPQHAVLRGPRQPHLLRDEMLSEIFAPQRARACRLGLHGRPAGMRLTYARRRRAGDSPSRAACAAGRRAGRRRRPVDGARHGTADRPDRHRQDRRRLAALRRRRARRAHRRSACATAAAKRSAHRRRPSPPRRAARMPCAIVLAAADLVDPQRSQRRRCARARLHARSSRLHDLYVRFDGHAQGHRHHRPQHLPLPALRQRGLRAQRERRRVPGRLRRLRPVDGGNLDSLSRRRDACSSRRPRSWARPTSCPT